MAIPKLNKRLLKRVLRHLKAEPKRYDQAAWGEFVPEEAGGPACGTQACIAGWTVFLSVPKKNWRSWINRSKHALRKGNGSPIRSYAKRLLGLTNGEAYFLFGTDNYEHQFGKKGVKCAQENIERLIAGREASTE